MDDDNNNGPNLILKTNSDIETATMVDKEETSDEPIPINDGTSQSDDVDEAE